MKYFNKLLVILVLIASAPVFAKENLPLTWTPMIDSKLAQQQMGTIEAALSIVLQSTEFGVKFAQSKNRDANIVIRFTDRATLRANSTIPGETQFMDNLDGDGFSILSASTTKRMVIVNIFLDDVFFEKTVLGESERKDAFTRLAVVLGHELYGNAVTLLRRFNPAWFADRSQEALLRIQYRSEILAFQAGTRFIDRMLKVALPSKIKSDFEAARQREIALLRSFEEKAREFGLSPEQIVEDPLQKPISGG